MTGSSYRIEPLTSILSVDLAGFDCGDSEYNSWLANSALSAMKSGTSAVYVLLAKCLDTESVAGHFAICPTMVVRDSLPGSLRRGAMSETPGWLLTKLAVSAELRGTNLGGQLLREALSRIVRSADSSGGRVIVGDAGNRKLITWCESRGFKRATAEGVRLFLKSSTARKYLIERNLAED